MYSVDENFFLEIVSFACLDFYPNIAGYISIIFLFLDGTRNQIPDIDLLQLVPGSYFFLCLLSLIFFLLQSQILNRLPFEFDSIKRFEETHPLVMKERIIQKGTPTCE
jgi:hypothetical protein